MFPISGCISCQHKFCAKKVGLFESFDSEDFEKLLKLIERLSIPKGDFIFKEGMLSDRLYIVNGGSFKVFRYTTDGKEQILYILTEGDYFGELNLLKTEALEFSAIALEDTYLCTIGKEDFDGLLAAYPSLYGKILEHAFERISTLEATIQTLTAKDVDSRIATLLLNLAEQFGIQKQGHIEIPLKLTREEMANLIGLTRETVSRKLSQFQSDGLIELVDSRTIRLINMPALEAIYQI